MYPPFTPSPPAFLVGGACFLPCLFRIGFSLSYFLGWVVAAQPSILNVVLSTSIETILSPCMIQFNSCSVIPALPASILAYRCRCIFAILATCCADILRSVLIRFICSIIMILLCLSYRSGTNSHIRRTVTTQRYVFTPVY